MRALQPSANAKVERRVTSTDTMAKIWKLLESGYLFDCSNYYLNISNVQREVQPLLGLTE